MLTVRTYLKIDDDFLPIGAAPALEKDQSYVDGALVLEVEGTPLLGLEHWDLIDQLRAYLVDGLADLRRTGRFTTFFPDQPLEITFERIRTRPETLIRIIVLDHPENRGVVPEREFFSVMLGAARDALTQLRRVAPRNAASYVMLLQKLDGFEQDKSS